MSNWNAENKRGFFIMPKGLIKLINNVGIVDQKVYGNVSERKRIIDAWEKIYAKRFNECAIQICPYIYFTEKKLSKEKSNSSSIIRPPATYSNSTPFGIAKEI